MLNAGKDVGLKEGQQPIPKGPDNVLQNPMIYPHTSSKSLLS
jgi:hypothetical protein